MKHQASLLTILVASCYYGSNQPRRIMLRNHIQHPFPMQGS